MSRIDRSSLIESDLRGRLNSGIIDRDVGKFKKAEKFMLLIQQEATTSGVSDGWMADLLKSIGILKFYQQEWQESIDLFKRANVLVQLSGAINSADSTARILDWQSQAEWVSGEYESAAVSVLRALKLMQQLGLQEHFKYIQFSSWLPMMLQKVEATYMPQRRELIPAQVGSPSAVRTLRRNLEIEMASGRSVEQMIAKLTADSAAVINQALKLSTGMVNELSSRKGVTDSRAAIASATTTIKNRGFSVQQCSNPGCNFQQLNDDVPVSLKKCAQCLAVQYCSVNCQCEHWKAGHKQFCSNPSAKLHESTN